MFSNDIVSVAALPVIANPVPGEILSVSTLELAWTPPPVVIVIVLYAWLSAVVKPAPV